MTCHLTKRHKNITFHMNIIRFFSQKIDIEIVEHGMKQFLSSFLTLQPREKKDGFESRIHLLEIKSLENIRNSMFRQSNK